MKTFNCAICGDVTYDQYMVHANVWTAAGLQPGDHAHLKCLYRRLGRTMKYSDFMLAPINDTIKEAMKAGIEIRQRELDAVSIEAVQNKTLDVLDWLRIQKNTLEDHVFGTKRHVFVFGSLYDVISELITAVEKEREENAERKKSRRTPA